MEKMRIGKKFVSAPPIESTADVAYVPYRRPQVVNTAQAVAPLVTAIGRYDARRRMIEEKGGTPADLDTVTAALNAKIILIGPYSRHEVSLVNQVDLKLALRDIHLDLHLDVRLHHTHMPVYYLCRTHGDLWVDYRLVVEDYYLSESYPLSDPRFARLMQSGHEAYYLRLSPWRDIVADVVDGGASS